MSYTQAKHILKNTKIDKTRKDWTVDEDIENFYDSYSDHIHKTRFFIYEHRKNPHLYEPIYKCRNADKSETIIIFNEYIYARLEQDNTTACTNYIQKVGLQDILVSFRNYFNNNYGENTGKQCIHHINQLIARDTAVINHWIRTLSKLKSSLQHWIDLRIPEILKREIDKATARHYKAIKTNIHTHEHQALCKERYLHQHSGIYLLGAMRDRSHNARIYCVEAGHA